MRPCKHDGQETTSGIQRHTRLCNQIGEARMQGRRSPEDPEAEELRSGIKIKPNLIEHLRILQYPPSLHSMVHTIFLRLTQRVWHLRF